MVTRLMLVRGQSKKKPGPKPDRLKIDGDWADAVGKAIKKRKPKKKRSKVLKKKEDSQN